MAQHQMLVPAICLTCVEDRLMHLLGSSMLNPALESFSPRSAGSSERSLPSSQSTHTSRMARRMLHEGDSGMTGDGG